MPGKNPTAARGFSLALVSWAALFLAFPVSSQEVVDVEAAVATALARPELEEILAARVSVMNAEIAEAVRVEVPVLSLSQEQVFGDAGAAYSEFSATVEQSFDLSGWRDSLRESGNYRAAALQADTQIWQVEVS
ncbi:MAG: hypothetical protein KC561_12840, partial [Myxococcales bacterium]|nr:hypothetical protein [Myxococcales bacterium]